MQFVGDEEDEAGHVLKVIALSLVLALPCAVAQGDARAQPVSDPMRPAGIVSAEGAAAGIASSGLQAVLISTKRKVAVIDGSVVPLGSTVRDSTLSGISDSGAVLKRNGGWDVLLMHPGIEKKPARRRDAK
jgi:hypothetical protein